MLICLLFALGVLGALFLLFYSTRLFSRGPGKTVYQYVLVACAGGSILWFTLINRLGMDVSSVRFKPFYVVRLLFRCTWGNAKYPQAVCRNLLRNSNHLFDSVHATPVEDLLLNIILFMPLGFLLPLACKKLNFRKTLLISLFFSLTIEITQYLAHLGCCDIDDIFNNTLGAVLGYGFYRLVNRTNK